MNLLIHGGRIIDPANDLDRVDTLCIADGHIAAIGPTPATFRADETIDAAGCWVIPGLVDLMAHLREPGQEHKGTVASETRAAVAGGVTTLCCPPDTVPVNDTPAVTEQIMQLAKSADRSRVLPIGALTRQLGGQQLSEMYALKEAGCITLSNAQRPITNTLVKKRALEYAATLGMTVFIHAEDPSMAGNGCVHDGPVSTRLGLPGIPECAEVTAVAQELELVEQTGVCAHFSQLSSARSAALIATARARGVPVTADVAIHQLYLTEMDLGYFNSFCHLRPPLRSQRDLDGLRTAVADGVITALCSSHQPHDTDAKLAPFESTEAGASSIEVLLPLTLRLVEEGVLSLAQAIRAVTCTPAHILGCDGGDLGVGALADLCIVDPDLFWRVEPQSLNSAGKNSPFLYWELKGRVRQTLIAGRTVFKLGTSR